MRPRTTGFTLLELLVTLVVLGILMAIAYPRLRPPSARLFANDVKAIVHQARYEAIKRNRPVAIVWLEAQGEFQIRFSTESALATAACDGASQLASKSLSDYRQLSVEVDMPTDGIVWLPSGQGRNCAGAPMISSAIAVSDGNNARTVEVSMGGKVSIK